MWLTQCGRLRSVGERGPFRNSSPGILQGEAEHRLSVGAPRGEGAKGVWSQAAGRAAVSE